MKFLTDKFFILLLCFMNPVGLPGIPMAAAALLAALSVSSLCFYIEQPRFCKGIITGYVVLCFFLPPLCFFLPLVIYDSRELYRVIWIAPVLFHMEGGRLMPGLFLLAAGLISLYLAHHSVKYTDMVAYLYRTQDDTREKSLHLEQKNRELLEKQEYEIRLATLSERNRIAREIHDNVGHLLTRALFQLGAMQVVFGNQDELSGQLGALKETLDSAMDNVRTSVHDLHEDSVDLESSLRNLADGFLFCPVRLSYHAHITSREMKSCFIAIVKEALANISRHSNATKAAITILEHPGFYQLTISDNGTLKSEAGTRGIGLVNMQERVDTFHGIFRTEQKNGFRIFISIPKS